MLWREPMAQGPAFLKERLMELFLQITLISTSIFLILFSLQLKTKNFLSSLIFKIIPFLCGTALLICFLYKIGILINIHQ